MYEINIIDKGAKRQRYIDIEKVPYKVFKIAQKLARKIDDVTLMSERIKAIDSDIETLKKDKPDGYKATINKLADELSKLSSQIRGVDDSGFFDDRFEAIKLILEMNGIEEDDELMKQETWECKMDYADPMALIDFAINKDLKKVMAATGVLSTKKT